MNYPKLRKSVLVVGMIMLLSQAVYLTVGIVFAETSINTEDEELVELPSMKNYLEEEQVSDPRFFFTRSRMYGTTKEPTKVTFFSDQEVYEAQVFLPKEATILKDQLPEGILIEQGERPNEWIVQSKRAQNTFVLPLVFGEAGIYELSVEETTAHLEISEKEETSEEVPAEETESSDEGSSRTRGFKNEEENHVISNNRQKSIRNQDFNTIVTSDNFLNYFGLSGTASVNGNIVTLTEARNSQSGSMYLKNKIDSTYPFILTGKVFLGHNSNSADGMGFGFHKDSPDAIGLTGSGFGLANLTDVFGFKLDTYYNGTNSHPFRPDPINTGAWNGNSFFDKFYKVQNFFPYAIPIVLDNEPPRM